MPRGVGMSLSPSLPQLARQAMPLAGRSGRGAGLQGPAQQTQLGGRFGRGVPPAMGQPGGTAPAYPASGTYAPPGYVPYLQYMSQFGYSSQNMPWGWPSRAGGYVYDPTYAGDAPAPGIEGGFATEAAPAEAAFGPAFGAPPAQEGYGQDAAPGYPGLGPDPGIGPAPSTGPTTGPGPSTGPGPGPGPAGPADAGLGGGLGGLGGPASPGFGGGFGTAAPSAFGGDTGVGIGDASPGFGDAGVSDGSGGDGGGGGGGK